MQDGIIRSIRQTFDIRYTYPVIFTSGVFRNGNPVLRNVIAESGVKHPKILVIVDSGVAKPRADLQDAIEAFIKTDAVLPDLAAPVCILQGGEECKNDSAHINLIHELINKARLCRHSLILAIGGGAMLDAAGYAAATAHRGIGLIRMPTTTLSQNYAGIGLKNAVNLFGRKNFIGTFAPPQAVINDFDFLSTLPEKEMRAGIAEAIKISLIKDRPFFDFLYAARYSLAQCNPDSLRKMIIRCAQLHLAHTIREGDPYETGLARPLDFGHWSAHKLEELTNGALGHGDAVAVGIALDSVYSWRRGMLSIEELVKILSVLADCGFDLYHPALAGMDVARAFSDFQEHLGGDLTIPLICGIGNGIEVNSIDLSVYSECIADLAASKGDQDEINQAPQDRQRNIRYEFSERTGQESLMLCHSGTDPAAAHSRAAQACHTIIDIAGTKITI